MSLETARADAMAGAEQRVSNLELFFDLVFVFTLTQLTALLAADLSAQGIARVALIFGVLWWMYGAYAWLTNIVPPDTTVRRFGLMAGMGAFLVCAIAIPRAFGTGGLAFGLGYLGVVVVHSALFWRVSSLNAIVRFVPFNVVAAVLVVLAATTGPVMTYVWWVMAVLLQIVTPYLAGAPAHYQLRTSHFVERHGLLLIVAFGESVVAIGVGTTQEPLTASTFLAALLGLTLAVTLWWTYFGRDEAAAGQTLTQAPAWRRSRLAINAYFVSYVPMLLGIIVVAAGVKRSLGRADERLDLASALALACGVALYLLGDVVFRSVLQLRPVVFRSVAAGAALGTALLGVWVTAAVQLAVLVVLVWIALGLEAILPYGRSAGAAPAATRPANTGSAATTTGSAATGPAATSGSGQPADSQAS